MKNLWKIALLGVLGLAGLACTSDDNIPCGQGNIISDDGYYILRTTLRAGEKCTWPLYIGHALTTGTSGTTTAPQRIMTEVTYDAADLQVTLDGAAETEPRWFAPRALISGEHALRVTANSDASADVSVRVVVRTDGPAVGAVDPDQSLHLTAGPDKVEQVGLGRLMATLAADGHGGRLFERLLASFATTDFSVRSGPADLLAYLKTTYGNDPVQWNLDDLPFVSTSVQNRIDLADGIAGCGELRVTFSTTLPARPEFDHRFNFVVIFQQPTTAFDVSPEGTVHCVNHALRWARLSSGGQIGSLVEGALSRTGFLRLKTEERIGSATDWEFREWVLVPNSNLAEAAQLPLVFQNRPLFQTVDVERLNQPGPEHDAFMKWVDENAAALDSRRMEIPATLTLADGVTSFDVRPKAVRFTETAWTPLDLTGVPQATLDAHPELRRHIEVMGCTGCHQGAGGNASTSPEQAVPDIIQGYLSTEYPARKTYLEGLAGGTFSRAAYGPLQALTPAVLPP